MRKEINRREFVLAGAATAGLGVGSRKVFGRAPAVQTAGVKPVVVASGNGHRSRNSDGETCVEVAFRKMTAGDDVLDSLIAGVNIVELDPNDASVGYGGRPNADGVVQLDSCCMHGPKRQAGGVGALDERLGNGHRRHVFCLDQLRQLCDRHPGERRVGHR